MQKNADKTVTFTEVEMKSLRKMVTACNDAISSMPSDGDFLGWDNYRALQMWEDKLRGRKQELTWYIDEDDEDEPKKKNAPTTVDAWLDAYGKKRRNSENS